MNDAEDASTPRLRILQFESDLERVVMLRPTHVALGGLWKAPPKAAIEAASKADHSKPTRPPRQKNDPKFIAAARELRDRYTEQINAGLLLPPCACGKYDVSRQLDAGGPPTQMKQMPLLNAA